mmetsp:Transcript_29168/g.73390  ORF Transcript_29168/g.73390 Transcript_29168/m.73390 type:complete len:368 (-) Transcript_29168:32-1135(-)
MIMEGSISTDTGLVQASPLLSTSCDMHQLKHLLPSSMSNTISPPSLSTSVCTHPTTVPACSSLGAMGMAMKAFCLPSPCGTGTISIGNIELFPLACFTVSPTVTRRYFSRSSVAVVMYFIADVMLCASDCPSSSDSELRCSSPAFATGRPRNMEAKEAEASRTSSLSVTMATLKCPVLRSIPIRRVCPSTSAGGAAAAAAPPVLAFLEGGEGEEAEPLESTRFISLAVSHSVSCMHLVHVTGGRSSCSCLTSSFVMPRRRRFFIMSVCLRLSVATGGSGACFAVPFLAAARLPAFPAGGIAPSPTVSGENTRVFLADGHLLSAPALSSAQQSPLLAVLLLASESTFQEPSQAATRCRKGENRATSSS